ncbi:MAG: 16S rRNA (cytosine(1402)-N(4))-methyltransferase RsmH, partial [Chthoniobacterales bacterium]|nr:16S rRNA (cytosine(1402)-N(4))-methyltransferase RsmH [Chthoniobacterales bacterium]
MAENLPSQFSAGPGREHERRPRYRGKNPRRFEEKYKERDPARYAETIAKVLAAGKTPAGAHRPIMVTEMLSVLRPQPGELAVDCTLGYGGHAEMLLAKLQPGGHLLGLDVDSVELSKTKTRLRALGFAPETFSAQRSNFAGLPRALSLSSVAAVYDRQSPSDPSQADIILADLGVSSMQLDNPERGFSFKIDGPLDMRMNPQRGLPAASLLAKLSRDDLSALLSENSDEPHAIVLANALAGETYASTLAFAAAIRAALSWAREEERELSVRRVFQALRIAVNDEFGALEAFLRVLPDCLNPGGRVAILTFHSGEDRRVKKAFQAGLRAGVYGAIADDVIRPTATERHGNPRSASA